MTKIQITAQMAEVNDQEIYLKIVLVSSDYIEHFS